MKKILLVGDTCFFGENVSFLLMIKGFDLRHIKKIDQAINLIQILQSTSESFDLTIISDIEIFESNQNCISVLNKLSEFTKIIIAENCSTNQKRAALAESLLKNKGVDLCDVKKILYKLKTYLNC